MADLATKAYINLGEAQPPCWPAVADGDCNHDGVFNITDFGAIPDLNGNGVSDPEDLILNPKYDNGKDDDHDGYVDDISGWDFLYGDNDPLDTVDYGHGTGEAKDSTAAANGTASVGTCPNCLFIPVRVGDSFIADGGRFAAGVLFGLDSGADVIQEALGGAQRSAPGATGDRRRVPPGGGRRGVDGRRSVEAPQPARLARAHDGRELGDDAVEQSRSGAAPTSGYLALNGCTNFGGHTFVSVPSSSCSSEATGQSAGMVGLIESYCRASSASRRTRRSHRGSRATTCCRPTRPCRSCARRPTTSTSRRPTRSIRPTTSARRTAASILDTVRYPSTKGWDATFGYGRVNAYEMLKAVRDGRIPPEAMIDSPAWFDVLPTSGTTTVTGRVAAPRAGSYDYRVEWAPGFEPPLYPATDNWTVVASATAV